MEECKEDFFQQRRHDRVKTPRPDVFNLLVHLGGDLCNLADSLLGEFNPLRRNRRTEDPARAPGRPGGRRTASVHPVRIPC